MTAFNSILVANRGEIACRVIRSAKAQGYRTIAVYSEVDAAAPHVALADEALCIGPAPVGDSYLRADKILAAAASCGAQAIHPGYGFLSENADFARACEAQGLIFIGPSGDAIHAMGNKAEAKRLMQAAAVPCVPGYEGEDQSDAALLAAAESIELPLMVKAAAGGGGRGMRLVETREELANAIKLARAEAESAFGSAELILEKAIIEPRHVEVQVFADSLGNTLHLAERDCSVQRRHQKVIEEAPCPIMSDELRQQMGEAAVAAARSINYVGAGTVEFLLDSSGKFYFLEMNTRLQVEHPVTEMITGLDLVALQLQVAQGLPLGLKQDDIAINGHAIEVRLYAEDPTQNFMPTSGPIELWREPSGPGIRVDAGISSGGEVSPFYDPMVAKVIAHGANRDIARRRLIEALKNTLLFGIENNRDFLIACLENENFAAGSATTAFIEQEFGGDGVPASPPCPAQYAAAAAIDLALDYQRNQTLAVIANSELNNWISAGQLVSHKRYQHGDELCDLAVQATGVNQYQLELNDNNAMSVTIKELHCDSAELSIDGETLRVHYHAPAPGTLYLSSAGNAHVYRDLIPLDGLEEDNHQGGQIVSPMHGLLLEVNVKPGDKVVAGQVLATLEAMKMHHEITVPMAGSIKSVLVETDQQVAADELLIEIDVDPDGE